MSMRKAHDDNEKRWNITNVENCLVKISEEKHGNPTIVLLHKTLLAVLRESREHSY